MQTEILADCAIALSFGNQTIDKDRVNKLIADRAQDLQLPVLAQREVAQFMKNYERATSLGLKPAYIDTWDVLVEAKQAMSRNKWDSAVLVGHRAHIPRASKQAEKLGLKVTYADNLPSTWDKHSRQWWTRNPGLWWAHELFTVPFLKIMRRL